MLFMSKWNNIVGPEVGISEWQNEEASRSRKWAMAKISASLQITSHCSSPKFEKNKLPDPNPGTSMAFGTHEFQKK
jgi:hypothetical protein